MNNHYNLDQFQLTFYTIHEQIANTFSLEGCQKLNERKVDLRGRRKFRTRFSQFSTLPVDNVVWKLQQGEFIVKKCKHSQLEM